MAIWWLHGAIPCNTDAINQQGVGQRLSVSLIFPVVERIVPREIVRRAILEEQYWKKEEMAEGKRQQKGRGIENLKWQLSQNYGKKRVFTRKVRLDLQERAQLRK